MNNDETPLTLTPNPARPVPTERYVRLLVVLGIFLAFIALGYVALGLLSALRHTVLIFALGLLMAYVFDPIVEAVRGNIPLPFAKSPNALPQKKRPRWLGVLVVFVLLFGSVGTSLFLLGREGMRQAEMFVRDRDVIQSNLREQLLRYDEELRRLGIPLNLTETIDRPTPAVKKWLEDTERGILNAASQASRGLAEGILVMLIAAYFLLLREEMNRRAADAVSPPLRPYLLAWQSDLDRILGGFVRGQAIVALFLGIAAGTVCGLLGLRFWLLLGLVTALASLIPVIGPYLGAIPAVLSALLTPHAHFSPTVNVILLVVLFTILNEIGSKVLYPKLVGRALGLNEVLTLFVLLAGLELGGLFGVLFAAPLTALTVATAGQLWRLWHHEPPNAPAR